MNFKDAVRYCYSNVGTHLVSKQHDITMYAHTGYGKYSIDSDGSTYLYYWFNYDLVHNGKVILPERDFAPLFDFIEDIMDWEVREDDAL